MLKRAFGLLVLVMAVASLSACAHKGDTQKGDRNAAAAANTFTGTLRNDAAAASSENTGWSLGTSTGQTIVMVDVSKVPDQAKNLEGKRVTIHGQMSTRKGPNDTTAAVLEADQINLARE